MEKLLVPGFEEFYNLLVSQIFSAYYKPRELAGLRLDVPEQYVDKTQEIVRYVTSKKGKVEQRIDDRLRSISHQDRATIFDILTKKLGDCLSITSTGLSLYGLSDESEFEKCYVGYIFSKRDCLGHTILRKSVRGGYRNYDHGKIIPEAQYKADYGIAILTEPKECIITEILSEGSLYLAERGKLSEALEYIELAEKLSPELFYIKCNKGNHLLKMGRTKEAILCYDEALELVPSELRSIVLRGKGISYDCSGEHNSAIECYNEVLKADPLNLDVLDKKARSFYFLGNYSEAEQLFRESLRLNPKNTATLNDIGVCLQKMGKLEEAISCFKDAQRLYSKDNKIILRR